MCLLVCFGLDLFFVVGLVGVGAFGEPSVGWFSDHRRSSLGNKARMSVGTRRVVVCVDGLQRMTIMPFLPLCCCGLFGSFLLLLLLQWNNNKGSAGRPRLGMWIILSPVGTNKDAHPDQEADSQEVAANVILQEHGLGNDVSQDAIGGMIFNILYLSWIAVLPFFMSQTDGVQSQSHWAYLKPRGLSSAKLMM